MWSHRLLPVLLLSIALQRSASHSVLTEPQPFHPAECRQGGPGKSPKKCPGPCRVDRLERRNPPLNFYPPNNTAATWRRGTNVTIRYTRNNHAPGGFMRLTLVPLADMMNKEAHKRNAFFFSCWGAHPRPATSSERKHDRFGFSKAGSDGRVAGVPAAYYIEHVQVPTSVPDGNYVLGWAWYGGTGGKVRGNVPQRPREQSYFGDYWSCSYIRVAGGPLHSYEPVFHNGMKQYSSEGCMAFTDRPGLCATEPCVGLTGHYQKPAEFKNGPPPTLYPSQFRDSAAKLEHTERGTKGMQTGFGWNDWGVRKYPSPSPRPRRSKPLQQWFSNDIDAWKRSRRSSLSIGASACNCLVDGKMCTEYQVGRSACHPTLPMGMQPNECFDQCCVYCAQYIHNSCEVLGIEGGCR